MENNNVQKELTECREQINSIDEEIVRALLRRYEVVARVGQIKAANGLPVLNSRREDEVLDRVAAFTDDKAVASVLRDVYREIMAGARRLEGEKEQP